jgi:AcrR family transcriptional regulator
MPTRPSTKDRILASAMRLLDARGPGAVTLRAVGDAAGISQSAPYRHYADKRALLEAMARSILAYFTSAREEAERHASDPIGALDRLIKAYFDFARGFPVRYRFLVEISRQDNALGAQVRQAFGAVTDLVRAAQRSGEIKNGDAGQISALIFGAAYGLADKACHGPTTFGASRQSPEQPPPDLALLLMDLLAETGERRAS